MTHTATNDARLHMTASSLMNTVLVVVLGTSGTQMRLFQKMCASCVLASAA